LAEVVLPEAQTVGELALVAFTDLAALTIANTMQSEQRGELAAQLQRALDAGVVIEQAKGALVAQEGLSEREALSACVVRPAASGAGWLRWPPRSWPPSGILRLGQHRRPGPPAACLRVQRLAATAAGSVVAWSAGALAADPLDRDHPDPTAMRSSPQRRQQAIATETNMAAAQGKPWGSCMAWQQSGQPQRLGGDRLDHPPITHRLND
jgi:hypothetical protein